MATVLRAVGAGESLRVRCADAVTEVRAQEAIPLCHKVSLSPIDPGTAVVKYGQKIGEALEPIAAGRHVHVHNMRSARARTAP
ncbi:MAG: UxaA family hydrolase [Acetobacteraceae bacterium]|nr:UxaA family hydrolase [Acetobacteraceae bacterium]